MKPQVEELVERLFSTSDTVTSHASTEPFGVIYFTGWKEQAGSIDLLAQIVWWPPPSAKTHSLYFVILPNLKVGEVRSGDCFEIGEIKVEDRVSLFALTNDKEFLEAERVRRLRLFRAGLIKLIDFVIEADPAWLQPALMDWVRPEKLEMPK